MQGVMTRASGAVGFTLIDIGTKIQNAFSEASLKGQLSTATSSIAGALGGVFGDAVGSIAGDLGKAAGIVAEIFVNLLTYNIRTAMAVVGGVIKAAGYTIASGMIGGIVSGILSGGNPIVTAIGAIGAMFVFGITSYLQYISTIISQTIKEIIDILSKSIQAITAVLSAGFKIIGTIFGAVTKGITALWKSFWKGLVTVANKAIEMVLGSMDKLAKKSVEAFMQFESAATKAAKEIVDVYGTSIGRMEALIARTTAATGQSLADVGKATFNVVSSGFRKMGEAGRILKAASALAFRDMSQLSNATNAMIIVWQNYKDKVKDVAEVSKILSTATTLGVTDLKEMGPALKYIIPTAARYNVGLKEIMGTMGVMTRIFGKGSTSTVARSLNRLLETIYSPRSSGAKELEALGVNVEKLQAAGKKGGFTEAWTEMLEQLQKMDPKKIRKLFPTIQSRRASAIIDPKNVKQFKDIMKDMDSMGKHLKKQESMGKNLAERVFKRIQNIIQNIQSRFGKVLVSTIKMVLFSRTMEKLWMKLNKIFFSKGMSKRIDEVISFIRDSLKPVMDIIIGRFQRVVALVEKLASGKFFKVEQIQNIGKAIQGIIRNVTSLFGKLDQKGFGEVGIRMFVDGFEKAIVKIADIFDKLINDPEALLADAKAWWQAVKARVMPVMANLGTYLHSKFNGLIASLGLLFADAFNFGAMKMETGPLMETINILIATIKIAFFRLWNDVFLELLRSFAQTMNPVMAMIKSSLQMIVSILKPLMNIIGNLARISLNMEKSDIDKGWTYADRWEHKQTGEKAKRDGRGSTAGKKYAELEKKRQDWLKKSGVWFDKVAVFDKMTQGLPQMFENIDKILGEASNPEKTDKMIDAWKEGNEKIINNLEEGLAIAKEEAAWSAKKAKAKLAETASTAWGGIKSYAQKKYAEVQASDLEMKLGKMIQRSKMTSIQKSNQMAGAKEATQITKFGEGGYARTGNFSGQSAQMLHGIIEKAFSSISQWSATGRGDPVAQQQAVDRAGDLQRGLSHLNITPTQLFGKTPEQVMKILSEALERGAEKAGKERRATNTIGSSALGQMVNTFFGNQLKNAYENT